MKLPSYHNLTTEQDAILNLPLDESHLITGAPGTGKSIMALYRAQALAIDDRDPLILTYSNVLNQYTAAAADNLGLEVNLTTFHRWFRDFWRSTYGVPPPTTGSDEWAYDWSAIAGRFLRDPPAQGSAPDLILDEGQDLPVSFYRLASYLAPTVTVFADENQQIRDEQCTLKEIQSAIGVSTQHEIRSNSRNTREIARLASHFYCGSPYGAPELSGRAGPLPSLRRFTDLDDFARDVARHARTHPDQRIGVACRFSKQQLALLGRLREHKLPVPVQTYVSAIPAFTGIDFAGSGVLVVNYASLKGLEFDTLFAPELQLISGDLSSASVRMLFYVITSRARSELRLSWIGDGPEPPIVADLDSSILERQS